MRKFFSFFFMLLLLAGGAWVGYWSGEEGNLSFALPQAKEEKSVAFVIRSYEEEEFALNCLRSIFEQEYDCFKVFFFDAGSRDGTFEGVEAFCKENHLEEKLFLFQGGAGLQMAGALFHASSFLKPSEIVIPMEAKDFLAHPQVLKRINLAHQDPHVCLAAYRPMLYPSYERGAALKKRISPSTPISFTASLLQKIPLGELWSEGYFLEGKACYVLPLLQMCKEKCALVDAPLFFQNEAFASKKERAPCKPEVLPLSSALLEKKESIGPDLLFFSYNRPLQLYACLESVSRYFSGYERIVVLCRADDARYARGYAEVARAFPHVEFVYQEAKSDFKPLLLKELFASPSPYIAFGVDDQIATDFVDLKECTDRLEALSAYGFYLRLGSQISYSYQCGKEQQVPPSLFLGEGLFAWNLKQGFSDWDFPHTVDMTIYRKSDLKVAFEKMRYKTPNSLEFAWARKPIPVKAIGLYFERPKVVNTPLNIVGRTGNPHMEAYPVEDLLAKFEEGLKIDIAPLYQIENQSPHIEYFPTFVTR